jgi:CRISPR-associated protein (TIGR02584 family)
MLKKNILICVTGLTPQIVTESFYCLTIQQKIPIHEIFILTTTRGKDVILGIDKAPNTPKVPLLKELEQLCKKYKVKLPKFENSSSHIITAREESLELSDIRNDEHNRLFPNKVSEFIKNISSVGNTLFCSISGGRKTMSVHLAFALVLFGREQDKLLHVLTSQENEFKGFYPNNKKEDKALTIAEIPFIRLRSFLHSKVDSSLLELNYADIVEVTQQKLKQISSKKLMLNIRKNEISLGRKKVMFEPLEFAIYYYFIEAKKGGNEKVSINVITSPEAARQIRYFLDEYHPYYYFNDKLKKKWWQDGIQPENFRTKRSKINEKLKSILSENILLENYCINSERVYGNTMYFVEADLSQLLINF